MSAALWSLADAYGVVLFVLAFVLIAGVFWTKNASNRSVAKEEARERADAIMAAIVASADVASRDTRELFDKVKEGRAAIEKDLEGVRSTHRHEVANTDTKFSALHNITTRAGDDIRALRDRVTVQETEVKHQTVALDKLESTVREKIDEVRDLIKSQGENTRLQFTELANSIREARDVKPRG